MIIRPVTCFVNRRFKLILVFPEGVTMMWDKYGKKDSE